MNIFYQSEERKKQKEGETFWRGKTFVCGGDFEVLKTSANFSRKIRVEIVDQQVLEPIKTNKKPLGLACSLLLLF